MTWEEAFSNIKEKEYFKSLEKFWDSEYKSKIIYPSRDKIFNAFNLTPLNEVKVVIFGQDPYHEPNQAMGLAFSVPDGIAPPPSLKNIFSEIEIEFNFIRFSQSGDLTYLAKQGVLLLNPILTVEKGKPLSHNIKEYKELTKDIICLLNSIDRPIVFMLWGNNAKKLGEGLNNPNHLVLSATHPSPLGANKGGWFNSNIFVKCNEFLSKNGINPVNWLDF